ncbi:uncharacterized protein LOC125147587 [Prionailurus viverrinus]|uniref:uncharacterized protein LOC125147587 n=1 Tax=Prionailurus viverrinus TaxID=61388 RepID=UPI001FF2B747|nr:uncharacterized protein LOC125147587 [Prionailurus viverrinus]
MVPESSALSNRRKNGKGVLSPATGREMRSTLLPSFPEQALSLSSWEPGERNRLHTPNPAGRPFNYGNLPLAAAAEASRRGSAEKAASARPACIRPAQPAPSLTPSHAPESTGATTHPAPQGRGSPGRRGAAPPQKARQSRQLRQVSSSWTLLLQPAAANTRAPPASVLSAALFPSSCETLPGTSEKSSSHRCPVQRQPSATRMERAGKDRRNSERWRHREPLKTLVGEVPRTTSAPTFARTTHLDARRLGNNTCPSSQEFS